MSFGTFIALFLLLPNERGDRICILSVAAVILMVGATLHGLSKTEVKR